MSKKLSTNAKTNREPANEHRKKQVGSRQKPGREGLELLSTHLQERFQVATSLFQGGRLADAERLLAEINAEHPDHPNVLHLRALVALKSGSNTEAVTHLKSALALKPEEPQFLGLLGTALKRQGDVAGAIVAFHKAIAQDPNNADVLYNFANLLNESNESDKAIHYYELAVSAEPAFADAHYNLGKVLKLVGRLSEAEAAYRKALELQPDNPEVLNNLGTVLCDCDRREEAIEAFRAAVRSAPGYREALTNLCFTFLELGQGHDTLAAADRLLEVKPGDTYGLAYKSGALQILGQQETLKKLIDIPRLLYAKRVNPPSVYKSLADFNASLGRHLASHPDLTYEPRGKSTRIGSQVSDLKTDPIGPIAFLEPILREAYDEYREALDLDPEHPFAASAPDKYNLSIFGTILTKSGHQIPHVHGDSWLSGIYYVEVPAEIKADRPERSGWVEFGRLPTIVKLNSEPNVEMRQPEEGLLLLFPAYLFHNTVPLTEPARRISIAFDFQPAD